MADSKTDVTHRSIGKAGDLPETPLRSVSGVSANRTTEGNMQLGDNSGGRCARGYSRKLDLLFLDVGMPAGIHP